MRGVRGYSTAPVGQASGLRRASGPQSCGQGVMVEDGALINLRIAVTASPNRGVTV